MMDPKEWYTTLMIDEIQLTFSLFYDAFRGAILGTSNSLTDDTLPDDFLPRMV